MKKTSILFLMLILIFCIPLFADETTDCEQVIYADISRNTSFYNDLRKHYDKIELRYIRGKDVITNTGRKYFIVERLSYYGIKNDKKYLLGYVTERGIYDKNSILLKEVETKDIINLGLSSSSLDSPWRPSYISQDTNWKNEIFDSEAFAYLRIDFDTNSLKLYYPEY